MVTDKQLCEVRERLENDPSVNRVSASMIAKEVVKQCNINLHRSTIRGRFIEMGKPMSCDWDRVKDNVKSSNTKTKKKKRLDVDVAEYNKDEISTKLHPYIPTEDEFEGYVERPVDKRLALHYKLSKYPLTQGKQGTGKTWSHKYFAYRRGLPFFLYSCYEDFSLPKLFGDKTIRNGSIVFQESLFVKAIQNPSVILFDEVNAISNTNTFDFHALLQNRQLYIKDANEGKGKIFKLHPDCKIGFAQNPKSAKYVGGYVKPSNFLGRCTYITYPEFTKPQVKKALKEKFPTLKKEDIEMFTIFYFNVLKMIKEADVPVDVSIRQIMHMIELHINGMELKMAIEDGLSSIFEAASQPEVKEPTFNIAQAIWKELT